MQLSPLLGEKKFVCLFARSEDEIINDSELMSRAFYI